LMDDLNIAMVPRITACLWPGNIATPLSQMRLHILLYRWFWPRLRASVFGSTLPAWSLAVVREKGTTPGSEA
jgi:hypothetical protein